MLLPVIHEANIIGDIFGRGKKPHLPDSKTGAKTVHLGQSALDVLRDLPGVAENPFVAVGKRKGSYFDTIFNILGVACAQQQILKGYAFTICGTPSPQVVSRSAKDYR